MAVALRLLLFVALGPFIGLVALMLLIGLVTLATSGSIRDFTFWPILFDPTILAVTYTVGGAPALLTAIASIFVRRRWRGPAAWAITALAGAIVSLVVGFAIFGVPPGGGGVDTQMTLLLAATGASAGFACASLSDGITSLLGTRAATA